MRTPYRTSEIFEFVINFFILFQATVQYGAGVQRCAWVFQCQLNHLYVGSINRKISKFQVPMQCRSRDIGQLCFGLKVKPHLISCNPFHFQTYRNCSYRLEILKQACFILIRGTGFPKKDASFLKNKIFLIYLVMIRKVK